MSKTRKRNKRTVPILIALVVLIAIAAFWGWKWYSSGANNYGKLGWAEAFDQVHARVSLHYPFTDWKGIDWDALYAQTAPRIAEAEARGDLTAHYLAWREYARAIPDGHVALAGDDDYGLRQRAIGGGYGLAIIGLDDGRVIAHILLDDGPASRAGMLWGAEILSWNGRPIAEALSQTSTLWTTVAQATREGQELDQARYLVRDPVGTKATVTFQNPGAAAPQTVSLVAYDDQMEALNRTLPPERDPMKAIFTSPIQAEVLPSGYGYISISSFMLNIAGLRPAKTIERAITSFVEQDVPGVILDVRGNGGGLDALVPQLAGHFYDTPDFYEYVSYYDPASGQFVINPDETLTIEPRAPHYGGPVMVLVDKHTVSTAEGPPLTIQRLPQGRVVGLHGTSGSFAIGQPGRNLLLLPEGLAFGFFEGRALDRNQSIQVDGNAEGIGGVVPDVRVPLTKETVHAIFVQGEDVVLQAAIAALDELE